MRGAELNEWHCNSITVFCLHSNTDNVKEAQTEQVEKMAPIETEKLHMAPGERQ